MKKLFTTSLVILVLTVGCATTHPGWDAEQVKGEVPRSLHVSVTKDMDLSDEANVFYDFTIENNDLSWLRVESAELVIANSEQVISNIIVGKDLMAWADSQNQKAKLREQNMNIATTAAILGGTAMMLAGGKGNSSLATVGAVTAVAGIGVQVARDIKKDMKAAEQSIAVPENHILGGPFTVPAKGLIKRWMLLGFPQPERPAFANLILTTVEGEKITYAFYLDNPSKRK